MINKQQGHLLSQYHPVPPTLPFVVVSSPELRCAQKSSPAHRGREHCCSALWLHLVSPINVHGQTEQGWDSLKHWPGTAHTVTISRFPEPTQYLAQKMPNPLARKNSQQTERTELSNLERAEGSLGLGSMT